MEAVAATYLRSGDVASAANLYTSLEHLNPKHSQMARLCRVLAAPNSVPLPHRHNDVCEAILNPLIPAGILLTGDETSAEAVQKRFQRLAVHAHPDKNPHTKAGEAFLRLVAMRDEALRLAAEQRATAAQRHSTVAVSAAKAPGKKTKPGSKATRAAAATGTSADRAQASTSPPPETAPVIPNLNTLKQTRITLRSLKRKDIDADFAIFSTTDRPQSAIDGEEAEAAEAAEVEQQLASTAPPRLVALPDVKPPPKRAAGVTGRPPPTLRHGKAAAAVLQEARKVEDECLAVSAAAGAPVGSGATSSNTSTNDLSGSDGRPPGAVAAAFAVNEDEKRAIHEQIDVMRGNLAQMRTQRTGIRLMCDLSFDTYQREKQRHT